MSRGVRARPVGALLLAAVGWLVVLVAADVGLGLVLGVAEDDDGPGGQVRRDDLFWEPARGDDGGEQFPAADTPAMRDLPWADAYWEEYAELEFDYRPFRHTTVLDRGGPLITVVDGHRPTWEPDGLAADAPELWFFGGSTMFGQGQRDDHTIASEVARLADAAGTPVRVVNLGVLGDTSWQDLHRFVAALAERPAPAAVVFYDGVNDVLATLQSGGGQPSHLSADAAGIVGAPWLEAVPPEEATWWDDYRRTSALAQAWRRLRSELASPAGAATARQVPTDPAEQQRLVLDAVQTYQRARALSTEVAREAGTVPVFFAQPFEGGNAEAFAAGVAPGSVDLTGAFASVDPSSVYIDGVHTNEEGARLVAEAMWPTVQAALGEAGVG